MGLDGKGRPRPPWRARKGTLTAPKTIVGSHGLVDPYAGCRPGPRQRAATSQSGNRRHCVCGAHRVLQDGMSASCCRFATMLASLQGRLQRGARALLPCRARGLHVRNQGPATAFGEQQRWFQGAHASWSFSETVGFKSASYRCGTLARGRIARSGPVARHGSVGRIPHPAVEPEN
jgi:hypothetical protein